MAINVQNVERFKFIAHKIIPLVYDDSLSYYEFLCKVMQKLNEVVSSLDNQNEILEAFDEEILDWETSTDNKYNQFVSNIDTMFEAFRQGEVAARNTFEGQITEQQETFETEISEQQTMFEQNITGQQNEFESSMQEQWDVFFDQYIETLGVVQTTGTSTTDVMSQKAVTDALEEVAVKITNLATNAATATDGQILASNGDGASEFITQNSDLIHVADEAENFIGENVEDVLAEIGNLLKNITTEIDAIWEEN